MFNIQKDVKNEKASPRHIHRSLITRSLALARRHPEFIKPYARLIFQRKVAVYYERRFRNGYSSLPARIQIHPTRRCNLKCMMCIQHRHSSDNPHDLPWYDPDQELPLEVWITLLDQVARFRPWINISGGEPMLYSRFGELIQAARQRALPVEINTNGTLLARQAEFLVQNDVSTVSVSIDGPEDIHDMIRGRTGLFSRSVKGIQALFEARRKLDRPNPLIQIACTISKSNVASLDEMVPLAKQLGADIVLFQHTDFNTPANIETHNLILSAEKAADCGLDILQPSVPDGEYYENEIRGEDAFLLKKVLGKAKQQANGQVQVFMSPDIKPDEIEKYYLDADYPRSQKCFGLWTNLRILPDGTVSPCLHVRAGNITEQPLEEIWNSTVMKNLRRLISQRLFPGCARCCHRKF